MEFYSLGEISKDTIVVNCRDAAECRLEECDFFPETEKGAEHLGELALQPSKGSLRANLQRRVRELESLLLDKQRKLLFAEDTVKRLERRVAELESRSGRKK